MDTKIINTLNIKNGAYLSPMAGFTDTSMRHLCEEYGAAYTVSEMVSAKALTMGDKKSVLLMQYKDKKAAYGIQLFGEDPKCMSEATKLICSGKYGIQFDFIDINMGCPAPKITKSGAGSALMKTPSLAGEIAHSVYKSAQEYNIPVTAKMRIGWDKQPQNATAPEIAKLCEQAGISAITVHGRTREDMYTPGINMDEIAKVKSSVTIPVIANGDITDAKSALLMLNYTNCDGLAIGRGALGNPWIFEQINAALTGKDIPAMPTIKQRLATMRRHIYNMCEDKGEFVAMQQARSQATHYMKGLKGAASLRRACCALRTFTDIDDIITTAYQYAESSSNVNE